MEIKKVENQANLQNTSEDKKLQQPNEEKGFFGSIWGGISDAAEATWDAAKTGYSYVKDGVEYVKEKGGWNDLVAAQDRADGRVELITKETKGLGYIPALAGNLSAQPADVTSYVSEKITTQSEKLDEAIDNLETKETKDNADKAANAGTGLLKAVASPVKLLNGVLNFAGGSSDVVSSGLKLEGYTNNLIDESTKKSLGIVADSLKDYSIENINDKKTAIAVATRLGIDPEKLSDMDTDEVRELIKREYDVENPAGKISRETVLVAAANSAAKELVNKNTDLLVHQFDTGVDKLDKAQLQSREAVSDVLNAPASVIDLTESGLNAGIQYVAGEEVAKATTAPLRFASGLLQTVTTSFDGKEGTTKKAVNKLVSGITFGLIDGEEEAKDEPKEQTESKPEEKSESTWYNPLSWFGGAEQEAVAEVKPSTPTPTREEVIETKKAEYQSLFEAEKKEAMTSQEAIKSRAEVNVDEISAKHIRGLYAASLAANASGNTEEAQRLFAEFDKNVKLANKNRAKYIEKAEAKLSTEMDTRLQNAELEAASLVANGSIDFNDAKRLAQRAENAGVAGTEFWNNIDSTYSNADNTAGERGLTSNLLSVGKGFLMTPLKAALKESVTTADKVLASMACHEIGGAVIAGYTAAKKGKEAVTEISNSTYNSALKQAGYEKAGEALAYATLAVGLAVPGAVTDGHCWHLTKHGENYHFGCGHDHGSYTPSLDDIFQNNPSGFPELL